MKTRAEWALGVAAAVLTASFVWGLAGGGWTPADASRRAPGARYSHGGKTVPVILDAGGCGAPGCHGAAPHSRGGAYAPFRNMHGRFVGCLVCHGRGSRGAWIVTRPRLAPTPEPRDGGVVRERWTIGAPGTPAGGKDVAHAALGEALSCRACHSADGSRDIAAKGGPGLPGTFEDPVALRMIEEGAKQWIPDTMR